MKILNLVLTALFALFAYFQLNDVDPWGWTSLYGAVAIVSGFAAFDKYNRYVILGLIAICVIWFLYLIPEFVNWINMGMPTITGKMKATEPHIEYTREFLGLFICIGALLFHYRRSKKVGA